MKIIKEREPSAELKILRLLHPRMQLPDPQHYRNLEKGFAGELKLDAWLEKGLVNDCLVVNDLLLEHKGRAFQIDSLVIFQKKIYVFDSKNHEGDFYLDANQWHVLGGIEINSPLTQMERAESLLRQILNQRLNVNFPIESFLIFVNPEFTLYNASTMLPAVFPTQLNPFMKKLNSIDSKTNRSHEKLAEQLVALHSDEPLSTRWPEYDYEQLKKGVVCGECPTIMFYKRGNFVCKRCGYRENVRTGVLRSVKEFKLLFPDRKITTNSIYEWCAVTGENRIVTRILAKEFKRVGYGIASYYVD